MASGQPPSLRISYGEIAVDVESLDVATLDWLSEFLRPGFRITPDAPDAPADVAVRFRVDAAEYSSLQRRLANGPSRTEPCFVLDTRVVEHSALEEGAGWLVHDDHFDCFHLIKPDSVDVIAHPSSQSYRAGLMRVVRELTITRHRQRPDRLQLHAAALELHGRGLLLAGPKRAGKTSLLVHGLQHSTARVISNDCTFVQIQKRGYRIRGMPTAVSVRQETTKLFPRLARNVPNVHHVSHMRLKDMKAALDEHGPKPAEESRRFSLAQLAFQLGVDTCPEASLDAIVFCRIDPDVGSWKIETLTPEAAHRMLLACRYGLNAHHDTPTLYERQAGFDKVAPVNNPLLGRLSQQLPILFCRLGPAAYRDADGPGTIFAEILSAIGTQL